MSIVTLVEAQPRVAADGSAVTVRLVANARRRADFGGVQSQPKLADVPGSDVSLGFDGRSFGQGAAPAVTPIGVTLDDQSAAWAKLVWKGAPVTVKTAAWPAGGDDPADADFAAAFVGRADGAAVRDGKLSITIVDASQPLRAALELRKGGATGDALFDGADAVSIAGRPLPRGWGQLEAVPGELVDKARLIYLFLANPAASLQGFEDGGYPITAGVARASLAALQATAPAAGTIDYCLDAGGRVLARMWTAPTYVLSANLTTAQTKVADIVAAIVAERTALTMAAGTVAAFNALQGATARLTPEQVEGKTIAEALDQLLAGVGGWWRLTSAGTIELGRWAYAAPAVTFAAHQVVSIERQTTVMPTVERTLGYRRNGKVHGDGDIAKALTAGGLTGLGDLATQNSADYSTQVSGAKPLGFTVVAAGASGTPPQSVGFYDAQGNAIAGAARSYVVRKSTNGGVTWSGGAFDVYAGSGALMATYLNGLADGTIVVIFSYDEPLNARLTGGLPAAMYRCGASKLGFGRPTFAAQSAYILVGFAGAGEGNGFECMSRSGGASDSWVRTAFQVVNGVPTVGGADVRDAADLIYADGTVVESLKPGQAGADKTSINTSADTAAVGGVPSATVNTNIVRAAVLGAAQSNLMPDWNFQRFIHASPDWQVIGGSWTVEDASDGRRVKANAISDGTEAVAVGPTFRIGLYDRVDIDVEIFNGSSTGVGVYGIYANMFDGTGAIVGTYAPVAEGGAGPGWHTLRGTFVSPVGGSGYFYLRKIGNCPTWFRTPLCGYTPANVAWNDVNGRLTSARGLYTAGAVGVRSTTSTRATATDQGGSTGVHVNLPAGVRNIPGPGGMVSVYYPNEDWYNLPYDITILIGFDDPNLDGTGTPILTDNPDLMVGATIAHVDTIRTPANGAAATTGGGGGGSGDVRAAVTYSSGGTTTSLP